MVRWLHSLLLLLLLVMISSSPPDLDPVLPHCGEITKNTGQRINVCYKFAASSNVLKNAVAADFSVAVKNTLYVKYNTAELWTLGLTYLDMTESTFTIGNAKFTFGLTCQGTSKTSGKVTAECIDAKKEGEVAHITIKLSASSTVEKDLMTAFGFYEENPKNEINLELKTKTEVKMYNGKGVANYPKYSSGHANFLPMNEGETAETATLDANNLFTCQGDKFIFLASKSMNVKEIRYTANGWLSKNGKKLLQAISQESPPVFCYNICKDHIIKWEGTFKPEKTTDKQEYKCKDSAVKISEKYYATVTCDENQWKGDSDLLSFNPSEKSRFQASCFGAPDFVKECDRYDKEKGCDTVQRVGDKLSCADGYALTVDGTATDKTKIYGSLRVVMGKWTDGSNTLGEAKATDKAQCFSKCAAEHVDVAATGTNTRNAEYDWPLKTLKCEDKTDVLIATLEGSENPYFGAVKCEPAIGWTLSGVKKDLKLATKIDDLKVKAHCYKACDKSKLVYPKCEDGWADSDCADPNYDGKHYTLKCKAGYVDYVNGEPMSSDVSCSAKGWLQGATLQIHHETKLKEPVNALCYNKCGRKFRSGSAPVNGNTITCDGTEMISYKVGNGDEKSTLGDLKCDHTGWIDGNVEFLRFVGGAPPTLNADCKPSCTANLIKFDCGTRDFCKQPNFADDKFTCDDPGQVLLMDSKLETDGIRCTKTAFTNEGSINIVRSSPTMQAEVMCISKCDAQFLETDPSAVDAVSQGNSLTKAYDVNNKYNVECKDALHYTTLHKGTEIIGYTAKNLVCDPKNGWSAADYKSGEVLATFDGSKLKAGCLDVCANRVSDKVCVNYLKDQGSCKAPTRAGDKFTCENKYFLRVNSIDHFRKELVCKIDGFYLHNPLLPNEADTMLINFNVLEPSKTFDVACISNCFHDFVEATLDVTKTLTGKELLSKLHCATDEILLIEIDGVTKRVFGAMTCDAAVGWKGPMAKPAVDPPSIEPNTLIVDFNKDVHFKASCVKVCDASRLKDICDESSGNCKQYTYNSNTLECQVKGAKSNHHRLYLNGLTTSESKPGPASNEMKCSNEGWFAGTEAIIDFRNEQVPITQTFEAICKHKCHGDFITTPELCMENDKPCTPANYPTSESTGSSWNMNCNHASEIIVLEHGPETKESFGEAKCSEKGWTDDKGMEMFKLDEFKYNIKARCEQLCHKDTLTGSAIASRSYKKPGDYLTCTEGKEMLKFDDIAVYSDMTCSKEGWRSDKSLVRTFEANKRSDAERKPKAECVFSKCIREFSQPCNSGEACTAPDLSKKYKMTCASPLKIIRSKDKATNVLPNDELECLNDNWIDSKTKALVLGKDETEFDVVCFAAACTGCTDTRKRIDCNGDPNCVQMEPFKMGEFAYCGGYSCPRGFAYKIRESDTSNKYNYYKDASATNYYIKCSKKNTDVEGEFFTPDGKTSVVSDIGCVKKIPCIDHSPLNLADCTSQKSCDADKLHKKLVQASKKSGDRTFKCDAPDTMYLWTSANEDGSWKTADVVDQMTCNDDGAWDAVVHNDVEDPATTNTITLERAPLPQPRIVCSPKDPTYKVPIVTTTAEPPNPIQEACAYCRKSMPVALPCEGCQNFNDTMAMKNSGDGKCIMETKTGRFVFNDGKSETTGDLTCQKDDDGNYKWKDAEGRVVTKLAVIVKALDVVDTGLIIGIVLGALIILGTIVAVIVYFYIKRKREAARLETLKSKGLEQKQDSIIDNVSVVDVKTIML